MADKLNVDEEVVEPKTPAISVFAFLSVILLPFVIWDIGGTGRDVFYEWEAYPFFTSFGVALINLVLLLACPKTTRNFGARIVLAAFSALFLAPLVLSLIYASFFRR